MPNASRTKMLITGIVIAFPLAILAINGQAVQRQYLREAEGRTIFREQIGDVAYEVAFESSPRSRPPDTSVTVPVGQFFVMGDNRFDARDSRFFGPVPFRSVIGRKL